MILKIRTKDNLEELVRHRNSPSWVIAEYRVNQIKKVEIYQFNGKKVLKADFDLIRSSRTEDNRLIVAFSNAIIEEVDYKWVGQNPIKYEYLSNIDASQIHELEIKVGFYAGKVNEDDGDIDECCYAGEKPDFIVLGGFTNKNDKKVFVGRVITNWCDKYPSESLVYGDKSVWDIGGIAEDENGIDLWISTSNDFPNLFSEIEALYEYLEIDSDEEHYNLSKEIPDELRLSYLFEGETINLKNVKKGNGFKLDLELVLQNFKS
jgi:hypothetical protein